jgi:hypothetical protein
VVVADPAGPVDAAAAADGPARDRDPSLPREGPHARAYEGLLDDAFRHPLFGWDVWFDQQARPYILPAIDAAYPRIRSEVNDALAAAHRRVGLA